jgi:hypothetical protein
MAQFVRMIFRASFDTSRLYFFLSCCCHFLLRYERKHITRIPSLNGDYKVCKQYNIRKMCTTALSYQLVGNSSYIFFITRICDDISSNYVWVTVQHVLKWKILSRILPFQFECIFSRKWESKIYSELSVKVLMYKNAAYFIAMLDANFAMIGLFC